MNNRLLPWVWLSIILSGIPPVVAAPLRIGILPVLDTLPLEAPVGRVATSGSYPTARQCFQSTLPG